MRYSSFSRALVFLNLLLSVIVAVLGGCAYFFWKHREEHTWILPKFHREKVLPKNGFAQRPEAYAAIGTELRWVEPKVELPDLREEILFYGRQGRPDVEGGIPLFHIGLVGSGETMLALPGEKIYLRAQQEKYLFSNRPTALFLEGQLQADGTLHLDVSLRGSEERDSLELESKDFIRAQQAFNWELGGQRVDPTLLVRQKARWAGPDRFLELHGGESFAFVEGRERIDFFDDETPYSCFLREGEALVWQEGRWQEASKLESTRHLPLLFLRKVEERVVFFDLWEGEGRNKHALSLMRQRDSDGSAMLVEECLLVGAKTFAQFILQCNKERFAVRVHDWLLRTEEGWELLDTPEAIDSYVMQEKQGALLVLDKAAREEGRQVLLGHLFNRARTEVVPVEFSEERGRAL